MDFLAVLDYDHLDNGVFLTSFAKSLAKKNSRGLIIHGDSEHTERIIQTGVMRNEAKIRAIKELNHRLVALFADEGVSTIALNGFQKQLLTYDGSTVEIDKNQIDKLPEHPMVLISNLAIDTRTGRHATIPLTEMATALSDTFKIDEITIFSMDESSDFIKQDFPDKLNISNADKSFIEKHIPEKLRNLSTTVQVKTGSSF
ncbi:MAG: hypothetical protein U5K72_11590 [Balneolaceae bacterium]|nr:hypothetical protein [Balneolaceae bacterium]